MDSQERDEIVDAEILECVGQLIGQVIGSAERIASSMAVPAFFIKALHSLDCPMAMKELGRRMHCDPSFVTSIADMLEKRGLAMRQPHPGDRRVKDLILTDLGQELRRRTVREVAAAMPWQNVLTSQERCQFLALLRKMTRQDGSPAVTKREATRPMTASPATASPVTASPVTASPVTAHPPAGSGEVTSTLASALPDAS